MEYMYAHLGKHLLSSCGPGYAVSEVDHGLFKLTVFHTDHCLETLRRTIMCHGNVGLYSFVWDDPAAWKPSLRSNSKSVCARWSSIENWAYSRKTALNPELRRIEPEATV